MKKLLLLISLVFVTSTFAYKQFDQVTMGDPKRTDPSALLEMYSTSQGFLMPRMTTAQRDAIVSPADALIIYNTDVQLLEIWDGVSWDQLGVTDLQEAYDATSNGNIELYTIFGGFSIYDDPVTQVVGNLFEVLDATSQEVIGVTSTTLNAVATDSGTLDVTTRITFDAATADRVPYFDGSNNLVSSAIDSTELNYLDGGTENIQNALNTLDTKIDTTSQTLTQLVNTTSQTIITYTDNLVTTTSQTLTQLVGTTSQTLVTYIDDQLLGASQAITQLVGTTSQALDTAKADTDLNNLGVTSINDGLYPATDDTVGLELGAAALRWDQAHIKDIDASNIDLVDTDGTTKNGVLKGTFGGVELSGSTPVFVLTDDDTATDAITIATGSASAGNSGNIVLQTGTATGTRGNVTVNANEMDITGTGSVIVPVGTTAQRPASPTQGMFRYNDTDSTFEGYSNGAWGPIGGGGGSLDFFYAEDFEINDSSIITVSGTWGLANLTSGQIAGNRSIVLTQASGSLGATATLDDYTIETNQIDTTIGYQFRYMYDGGDSDIDFVVQEIGAVTQEIGRITLPSASSATTARLIANTTTQATALKAYFEVITENSGKLLKIDNIEAKTNPLPTVESVETAEYHIRQANTSMSNLAGDLQFNLGTATIDQTDNFSNFVTVADDSGNTRTTFTAVKDAILNIHANAISNGDDYISVRVNGTARLVGSGEAGTYRSTVGGSIKVKAGDIVTIAAIAGAVGSYPDGNMYAITGYLVDVQITAQATSANVVFEGEDDSSEFYYSDYASNFWDAVTATDEWDHTLLLNKNKVSEATAANSRLITISDVSGQTRIIAKKKIELTVDLSSSMDLNGTIRIYNSSAQHFSSGQADASGGYKRGISATFRLDKDDYVYVDNSDPYSDRGGAIGITATPIDRELYSVPVTNEVENVYSARIDNNGSTATIKSQNSSWLTVTRTGTGALTLNYSALGLTENPAYQIKATSESGGSYLSVVNTISSTQMTISTVAYDSPYGAVDSDVAIIIQRQGSDYRAPKGYFLGNLAHVEYQTKILSADVSTAGVLSDLTFNNLEVGKHYRVTLQNNMLVNDATYGGIDVFNGSSQVGQASNDTANPDGSVHVSSWVFQAEDTTLTFTYLKGGTGNVYGNGTRDETFATLEELLTHRTTNKWD